VSARRRQNQRDFINKRAFFADLMAIRGRKVAGTCQFFYAFYYIFYYVFIMKGAFFWLKN
jgi:hypothetical protein